MCDLAEGSRGCSQADGTVSGLVGRASRLHRPDLFRHAVYALGYLRLTGVGPARSRLRPLKPPTGAPDGPQNGHIWTLLRAATPTDGSCERVRAIRLTPRTIRSMDIYILLLAAEIRASATFSHRHLAPARVAEPSSRKHTLISLEHLLSGELGRSEGDVLANFPIFGIPASSEWPRRRAPYGLSHAAGCLCARPKWVSG